MSDDERDRRSLPKLVVLVLVPLLGATWYLRNQVLEDHRTFIAFCRANHPGMPWREVLSRAATHGWSFVPQSAPGRQPEEYLAAVDMWTYRVGCVVTVKDGRVVRTRDNELPKE